MAKLFIESQLAAGGEEPLFDGIEGINIINSISHDTVANNITVAGIDANQAAVSLTIPLASTSNADIDARVNALVRDWALEADGDPIDRSKIPQATDFESGAVQKANSNVALTGTDTDLVITAATLKYVLDNRKATTSLAGTIQLATIAEARAGTDNNKGMSPLGVAEYVSNADINVNNDDIDARIASWARAGNADDVPLSKLPDASESGQGVIEISTDAEAAAGTDTTRAINAKQLRAGLDSVGVTNVSNTIKQDVEAFALKENSDTEVPDSKLPDGDTATKGIVQLVSSGGASTDTTKAATPNYVNAQIAAVPNPSSGLNQTQVDARVRAGVADWAETSNTDAVPSNKLPVASESQDGVISLADRAEAQAGTNDTKVMTPAKVRSEILSQVADWAEQGNTDVIPPNKFTAATTDAAGTVLLARESDVAGQVTNTTRAVVPKLMADYVRANAGSGGGGGGGPLALTHSSGQFASETDATEQTLSTTGQNQTIERHLGAFTGVDVTGIFEKSESRGAGRITIVKAGLFSLSWEVNFLINSFTGTQAAEFELIVELHSSDGTLKRIFGAGGALDDPISRPLDFNGTITIPLWIAEAGDYLLAKVGFKSSENVSRRLRYQLGNNINDFDINFFDTTNAVPGPQGIQGPVGMQGPRGDTGPAGQDGQDGAAGRAGTPGADGAQGPQGNPGPRGPAGQDGTDGARGPAGPQGNPGPTGPRGPDGAAGADGADGAQGPQGVYRFTIYRSVLHGATRPATPSGGSVSNGALTAPTSWSETFPTEQVRLQSTYDTYESFANYNPASNSLGSWSVPFKIDVEAGPAGPAGPQGNPGARGPAGPAGQNGQDGAPGAQGQQGVQGEKGDKGDKGDPGNDGAAGARGPQGLQGPAGDPGAQGAKGDKGDPGNDGAAGAPGVQGPRGLQGPAGQDGQDGARGPAGQDGQDGAAGSPGAQGERGPIGPQGPAGPAGPTGPAGSGSPDTGAQIVTKLEGLTGVDRLEASAIQNLPKGTDFSEGVIAFDALPSDVSKYPLNTVVRVNQPGGWYEVDHDGTQHQNTIRFQTATASGSTGASVVSGGSGFESAARGVIETQEGTDLTQSDSPIGLIAVEPWQSTPVSATAGQLKVYVKASLNPPEVLYYKAYNGVPSATTLITPPERLGDDLDRSDNTVTLNGTEYYEFSNGQESSALLGGGTFGTNFLGTYMRFWEDGANQNPFDIFKEGKVLKLLASDAPDFNTPRRVSSIPDTLLPGDKWYLTDQYIRPSGIEITPQEFAGTELDGLGLGIRGWYTKEDAGFNLGYITPGQLSDDFVLISNTRVYVKRGTQTNLTHIVLGDTEYPLVRVPQPAGTKVQPSPDLAAGLPDVDYYTITGGLPAGDWDNLRFKTSIQVNPDTVIENPNFLSFSGHTQAGASAYYFDPPQGGLITGVFWIDDTDVSDQFDRNEWRLRVNSPGNAPTRLHVGNMSLRLVESVRFDTNTQYTARLSINQPHGPDQAGVFSQDIRIEFADGTFYDFTTGQTAAGERPLFIPAAPTFQPGPYVTDGTDIQEDEYNAPAANPSNRLKFQVEETVPGLPMDETLDFINLGDGSSIVVINPFDDIDRIVYNGNASDAGTFQRYTVRVVRSGSEYQQLSKLKINGLTHSLSYFETDQEYAVYRTPVTQSAASRIRTGSVSNCNIQLANGEWLGHSGVLERRRTITKEDLAQALNDVPEVHAVPNSPSDGQRVQLLNSVTVPNPAQMVPRQGSTAGGANYVGYFKGTPDVGSLTPESDDITSIAAHWGGSGTLNNKIVVTRSTTSTKTPTYIEVRSRRYTLVAAGSGFPHDWVISGAANQTEDFVRHFFTVGVDTPVNIGFSDGTSIAPDATFAAGDVIAYDATRMMWVLSSVKPRSDGEISTLALAQINTRITQLNLKTKWYGTQAEYDAITDKDEDTEYNIFA